MFSARFRAAQRLSSASRGGARDTDIKTKPLSKTALRARFEIYIASPHGISQARCDHSYYRRDAKMQDYRAQILNPCARRIFSPHYKIKLCEYSPPLLLASKSISAAAPLFSHSTQNPRIPHSTPLTLLRTQAACV